MAAVQPRTQVHTTIFPIGALICYRTQRLKIRITVQVSHGFQSMSMFQWHTDIGQKSLQTFRLRLVGVDRCRT
jgi:hypothetical protein